MRGSNGSPVRCSVDESLRRAIVRLGENIFLLRRCVRQHRTRHLEDAQRHGR